jgi:hypothetical protein
MKQPIKDVTKVIGGRRFRFGELPAELAFRVLMVVVRNLGSPLAGIAAGTQGKKIDVRNAAAKLTGDLLGKLNDDEIRYAMDTLYTSVACVDQEKTGKVTLETTFQGRLLDAFKVAVEAFKVNFADFLDGALSLSSDAMEAESSQSNPPTSIGTSGSPAE